MKNTNSYCLLAGKAIPLIPLNKQTRLILLVVCLLGATAVFCKAEESVTNSTSLQAVSVNSKKAPKTRLSDKSRILETGNDVIIDGSLRVLEQNFNKSIDLVEISTPVTPSTNHGRLFLRPDGTAQALILLLDDGSAITLGSSGAAAGDITDVNAGLGLIGGGTSGSVTVSLSTPIVTSYITDFVSGSSVSVTYLRTSSATLVYLQQSSATLTYLMISSASATYLNQLSAASLYLTQSSSTLTNLQQSSATLTYLTKSSATLTYVTQSSAAVTYCNANGTNCTSSGGSSVYVKSVQCTVTTSSATNTTIYANTNLSCTITPASSSNKINISVSGAVQLAASGTSGTSSFSINRGTTRLSAANGFIYYRHVDAANSMRMPLSIVYQDSPSTTSATTYTLTFTNDSGVTVTFNDIAGTAVMLLEEVTQ